MTDKTGPETPDTPDTESSESEVSENVSPETGRPETDGDDTSASSAPDSVTDAASDADSASDIGGGEEASATPEEQAAQEPADEDENSEEDDGELHEMGLLDHLAELRSRLVRCVIAVGVGFCASYAFSEKIFDKLMEPMVEVFRKLSVQASALPADFFEKLKESLGQVLATTDFPYMDKLDVFVDGLEKSMSSAVQMGHFQYTYPPEAFFTYIKVSIVAGIFLVSPYLFYQVWGFVAPGLYKEERRYIVPIAVLSAVFFVSGSLFGYFIVFPFGFEFFSGFSNSNIQFIPKLSEYLSFCLKLLFAFGIVFELPLFIFFLARLGLVSSKGLRAKRKYAILIAFVLAAVLTPPDPFTQTLMAGPLVILYEVGVWVAFFFGKKEDREGRAEKKRKKAEAKQRKIDEKLRKKEEEKQRKIDEKQRKIDEKKRLKEEKKQRKAGKKNKAQDPESEKGTDSSSDSKKSEAATDAAGDASSDAPSDAPSGAEDGEGKDKS